MVFFYLTVSTNVPCGPVIKQEFRRGCQDSMCFFRNPDGRENKMGFFARNAHVELRKYKKVELFEVMKEIHIYASTCLHMNIHIYIYVLYPEIGS